VAVMGARQAVAGDEARAKAEEGVEPLEEMRLFYVGATRGDLAVDRGECGEAVTERYCC